MEREERLERIARAIWKVLETHSDPEAETLAFNEEDWADLLIESERDEYRTLAARCLAAAMTDAAPSAAPPEGLRRALETLASLANHDIEAQFEEQFGRTLDEVLAAPATPDSLDAAWAAVESMLPDGIVISPSRPLRDGTRTPVYVDARTARPTAGRRGPRWFHWRAEGDTLPAALRALASRLAATPEEADR